MTALRKSFFLLLLCGLLVTMTPLTQAAPAVNMTVTDADVRDVLTAMAAVGNVNIIIDSGVNGRISVDFKNVPFDTALEFVTKSQGLVSYQAGKVIVVTTAEKLTKGFSRTQIFKLENGKPEDMKKSLGSILPEDRIKIDVYTNSIIVSGTPAEIEGVAQALKLLDVPFKQIMLEAQVMALSKGASKKLGIDWNWASFPQTPQTNTTAVSGTSVTSTAITRTMPGTITFGMPGSMWATPEGTPYEFQWSAKLNALISNDEAKLLARPNVMTINGKEATILIGDKIPVVTETADSSGKTTATTVYVDAGIKLTYTPRIGSDNVIYAAVRTEVSTPTLVTEMKAYKITTRSAETNVRMKDGETLVIGGLISSEDSGGKNKIPFLGDLPILGKLFFQSISKTKTETEVVIFLKAKIVE